MDTAVIGRNDQEITQRQLNPDSGKYRTNIITERFGQGWAEGDLEWDGTPKKDPNICPYHGTTCYHYDSINRVRPPRLSRYDCAGCGLSTGSSYYDLTTERDYHITHCPALGLVATTPEYRAMEGTDFESTFAALYSEAFRILCDRQGKYGPNNITQQGIYGVVKRIADDKMQRVMGAISGTIDRGVTSITIDQGADEDTFEDGLIDIANYALIALALHRGLWGRELSGTNQGLVLG